MGDLVNHNWNISNDLIILLLDYMYMCVCVRAREILNK